MNIILLRLPDQYTDVPIELRRAAVTRNAETFIKALLKAPPPEFRANYLRLIKNNFNSEVKFIQDIETQLQQLDPTTQESLSKITTIAQNILPPIACTTNISTSSSHAEILTTIAEKDFEEKLSKLPLPELLELLESENTSSDQLKKYLSYPARRNYILERAISRLLQSTTNKDKCKRIILSILRADRFLLSLSGPSSPLLYTAAKNGSVELFIAFFKNYEVQQEGASLFNLLHPGEMSALAIAALNGHTAIFFAFLEECKDKPEIVTKVLLQETKLSSGRNKIPPLFIAAEHGLVDVILASLNYFKNDATFVNKLLRGNGSSLVHVAAEYGQINVIQAVQEFFKDKPEIFENLLEANESGNTPLHCAAIFDRANVFELFHRHYRGDITALKRIMMPNHDGNTPLQYALQKQSANTISWLYQTFKNDSDFINDLCRRDRNGNAALHLTVLNYLCYPLFITLLKLIEDESIITSLMQPNNAGLSPLSLATRNLQPEHCYSLLDMLCANSEIFSLLHKHDANFGEFILNCLISSNDPKNLYIFLCEHPDTKVELPPAKDMRELIDTWHASYKERNSLNISIKSASS